MTSKALSVAVVLVIGGAAINAGPAAAGPIGPSTFVDVASPDLVLDVKQRVVRERLTGGELLPGAKPKKRKRLVTDLEEVRALELRRLEAVTTPELRRF